MKINTCLLSSIRDAGCLSPRYTHRQSPSENENDGNNYNIFTTVLNDLENGFPNPLENADLGLNIAAQEEVVRYDLSTLSPTFRGLNLSSPTRRAVAKAAILATGDNLENSLLGRSQARRMKLQQSYNEIISSPRNSSRIKSPATPSSEQWQQQYSQEEERDDRVLFPVSRSYAAIKSPRVQKLFNFDIRDDNDNNNDDEADHHDKLPKWNSKQQRREYRKYIRDNDHDDEADNNNHHGNNTDTAPPKWNSTQQRREYRKSLQKSSQIDIAEIEQFTKDMRMRIQRYNDNSPKMMMVDVVDGNKKDEKKKKQRQQLEVVEVKKKEMNVKRQSHSSVVKKNSSTSTSTNKEDTTTTTTAAATVASRWKALRTKQKDDNNDYITDEKTIRSEKEEVPDDEIEAWWNERLQNAAINKQRSPTTPSASDRLDERLKSLRNNNKIKQQRGSVGGAGGTTTAFRELEGEPTLEDDIVLRNVLKKKVNFIAPSKENGDSTTPTMTRQALNNRVVSKVESTFFDTDAMNKKQRNVTTPSSSVVGGSITAKRTTPRSSSPTTDSQSHSQSNSVASGTLQIILTRIDEAKEQFAKALKDNDVKKQSELAALLAQLGEAAVAMRKLGK